MPKTKVIPKPVKIYRKKLNILGNDYTIKIDRESEMNDDPDQGAVYGWTTHALREIHLSDDLLDDDFNSQLQETFLHEIIHAILGHGAGPLIQHKEDEEAIIVSISNGLNVLGLGKILVEEYLK